MAQNHWLDSSVFQKIVRISFKPMEILRRWYWFPDFLEWSRVLEVCFRFQGVFLTYSTRYTCDHLYLSPLSVSISTIHFSQSICCASVPSIETTIEKCRLKLPIIIPFIVEAFCQPLILASRRGKKVTSSDSSLLYLAYSPQSTNGLTVLLTE